MTEVELKLNQVLYDPLDADRKLRDPGELDLSMDELTKMTQKEAYEKSPEITIGKMLGKLLTEGVQPKDVKTQAKLYRLGIKITDEMKKPDAIYKMDEDKLKEMKDFMSEVKGQLAKPKFLGQIYNKLEDLESELVEAKKKAE